MIRAVSSETEANPQETTNAEAGEAHGGEAAHEGSPLSHAHPTVLNAYPITLEVGWGREVSGGELEHARTTLKRPDLTAETLSAKWWVAAERFKTHQLSPTPATAVQWVGVPTVGSWGVIAALLLLVHLGVRRMQKVPGRLQSIFEWAYGCFRSLSVSMIGEEKGPLFTPLLATFFLYILCLNLGGLIPGYVSATAGLNMTIALALCCFVLVQYFGFKHQGLRYLMHFVGEPWWLFPLNIPIHVLGELARPLSLSVRLFGNIFGEDTVIAQLVIMGAAILSVIYVPIPVHFPMLLFGIFGAFVQALVFTMLSASYISGAVASHH